MLKTQCNHTSQKNRTNCNSICSKDSNGKNNDNWMDVDKEITALSVLTKFEVSKIDKKVRKDIRGRK